MSFSSLGRFVLATVVLGQLLTGCSEEATGPSVMRGTIRGHVTGAEGVPLSASVRVEGVELSVQASTSTREDGGYELVVPPGPYLLYCSLRMYGVLVSGWYSNEGLRGRRHEADTLAVTESTIDLEVDFTFGGLQVALETPEALEGDSLRLEVSRMEVSQIVEGGECTFRIPALKSGDYTIQIVLPNQEPIWLPATHSYSEAESFTIRDGELTNHEGSIGDPAWVRGTITGSWQELQLPTPEILLVDQYTHLLARGTVDGEGRFDVPLYLGDHVFIVSMIDGIEQYRTRSGEPGADGFDLEPGQVVSDVFMRDYGLRVDVIRPDGYHPEDNTIRLYYSFYEEPTKTLSLALGQDSFSFGNLRPGDYYLHLRRDELQPPPWLPQWYDRTPSREEATPIVIDGSSTVTRIDLVVELGGIIRGQIFGSDGEPLQGFQVKVRTDEGESLLGLWRTKSDGSFAVYGLKDDGYHIGVGTEGGDVWWYPGTWDWRSSEVITISDHGEVGGIILSRPSAP
jgi:hypothetical protein